MKTVGVRKLGTHLPEYLREVAAGELILVVDRGRVVAELRAPASSRLAATVDVQEQVNAWRELAGKWKGGPDAPTRSKRQRSTPRERKR